MKWCVFVPGSPVPKLRARTIKDAAGNIRSYTPKKTVDWEQAIRHYVQEHLPPRPLRGPLCLYALFLLPRPETRPKRWIYPDRRPDLDNYGKAATDAICGLVYKDDGQVVDLSLKKRYVESGVFVGVEVVVEELQPDEVEKDLERERKKEAK